MCILHGDGCTPGSQICQDIGSPDLFEERQVPHKLRTLTSDF